MATEETDIELSEVWRQLRIRWPGIASGMVAGALLGILVRWGWPASYEATTTLLPIAGQGGGGGLGAAVAGQMGAFSGLVGLPSSGPDMIEVLRSRSLAEDVAATSASDVAFQRWVGARRAAAVVQQAVTIVAPSSRSKVVGVTILSPEATLSAQLANQFVERLEYRLDSMAKTKNERERIQLDERIKVTLGDLEQAEERLVQFQSRHHLASLSDEVSHAVRNMAELEAQRTAVDVDLRSTEESLRKLQAQVDAFQMAPSQLLELDLRRQRLRGQRQGLQQAEANFQSRLSGLPPQGLRLARLQRDSQLFAATYTALRQQRQTLMLRDDAASETFVVLDPALPPTSPKAPPIPYVLALGGILGAVAGGLAWRMQGGQGEVSA